jgi:hypothetical protein
MRLLALLLTLVLASCIDGKEEFWIEANGSGRAEITYDIPATAAAFSGGENGIRSQIQKLLDDAPKLTTRQVLVHTQKDRIIVKINIAYDSALDLIEIKDGTAIQQVPKAAQHLLGTIDFRLSGRTVHLTRTINPGKAIPGTFFIPKSQFAGRSLTYITHLPVPTESSNATRTENNGKTLIWEFPLASALQNPIVTRYQVKMPIPWWLIAGLIGILASLAYLIRSLFRKAKKRPSPPSTSPLNV